MGMMQDDADIEIRIREELKRHARLARQQHMDSV